MSDPAKDFLNFRGKTVYFYTRDESKCLLLTNPAITMVGGRPFLTGTVPTLGFWSDGLSAGVSWDMVVRYYVYDSLEEYANRRKSHKRKGRAKQKSGYER